MKVKDVVKTVIKWAPVAYPIIKKIIDEKNKKPTTTRRR